MNFYYIFCLLVFYDFVKGDARETLIRAACKIKQNLNICIPNKEDQRKTRTRQLARRYDATMRAPEYEGPHSSIGGKDKRKKRNGEEIDDDYSEVLETLQRKHSDMEKYCEKYGQNFRQYCKKERIPELEGVLPHFCTSYSQSCFNDSTEIPEFDASSLGVEESERVVEENTKRLFTGDKDQYCSQYAKSYSDVCTRALLKTQKESIDFCESYSTNCLREETPEKEEGTEKTQLHGESALKMVPEKQREKGMREGAQGMRDGTGEKVEGFTHTAEKPEEPEKAEHGNKEENKEVAKQIDESLKELENLNLEAETETKDETPPKAVSKKVTAYCEQYSENYNFYCAGEETETVGENEAFCSSFRKHCPDKVGSLKESGGFLGEKAQKGTKDSLYVYKGTRDEYCEKFSVNYEYYCKLNAKIDSEIADKFCPSYRRGCEDRLSSVTGPRNPFAETTGTTAAPEEAKPSTEAFPDIEHPTVTVSTRGGKRRRKGKKLHPCTPDCDMRIHPHCTPDCKCDWIYPAVQKFCNPPPIPLFLNTCRLWYNGCPQYERYHYASQFVYSKAEKGKRVEGPVGSRPFSVTSPTGEKIPVTIGPSGTVITGNAPSRVKRDMGMVSMYVEAVQFRGGTTAIIESRHHAQAA